VASVNAGRVELDLVAVARDQVSATLREVNKSLDQTRAKAEAAGGGTKGLREGVISLTSGVKEGIKPLNALREGFEQVRSNGLFVVSAVASVAGALVTLSARFRDTTTAMYWWSKNSEVVLKSGNELAAMTEKLRDLNNPDQGPLAGITGSAVAERVNKVGEGVAQLRRRITELREPLETLNGLFAQNVGTNELRGFLMGQIEESQKTITDLAKQEAQYHREATQAIIEQALATANLARAEELRRIGGAVDKGTGGAAKASDLFAGAITGEKMPERIRDYAAIEAARASMRGGGESRKARESREEMAFLLAEDFANRERVRKAEEEKSNEEARASRENMAAAMAEDFANRERMIESEKAALESLQEAYRSFGEGVREAFNAALPGLGDATARLGELAAQMAAVNGANEKAALGATGTIEAITMVAAANAETASEAFAYKALGEGAAALGSLAIGDAKGAALHAASAVAYGVAAAAAGGSGGGVSTAGGGGPSALDTGGTGGRSGPSITNVYVAPGTDPQAVARELRRVDRSARGTGLAANPGV